MRAMHRRRGSLVSMEAPNRNHGLHINANPTHTHTHPPLHYLGRPVFSIQQSKPHNLHLHVLKRSTLSQLHGQLGLSLLLHQSLSRTTSRHTIPILLARCAASTSNRVLFPSYQPMGSDNGLQMVPHHLTRTLISFLLLLLLLLLLTPTLPLPNPQDLPHTPSQTPSAATIIAILHGKSLPYPQLKVSKMDTQWVDKIMYHDQERWDSWIRDWDWDWWFGSRILGPEAMRK